MTPTPPSLDPGTKDRQQSGDINEQPASHQSLHNLETNHVKPISEALQQDNDSLVNLVPTSLDPNTKVVPQSIEGSSSEIQPTTVELQTPFAQATETAINTSPRIADGKLPTPCPNVSTPTVQTAPESDPRRGEMESTPEVEAEEDQEVKFQHLRNHLQRGLLPTAGSPKPEEMKAMSLCLGKLEGIENPSPSAIRASSIFKLLEDIGSLDEIPRDVEFTIKERAARLLEKWKLGLEKGDATTSSPRQPIEDNDISLNAITDKQKPVDATNPQQQQPQQLKIETKFLATDLTEKSPSKMVVKSEQSSSGHIIKYGAVPANNDPSLTSAPTSLASPTPLTLQALSKSRPERLVIDLTGDDEVDTEIRSEPSRPLATHQAVPSKPADATVTPPLSAPQSQSSPATHQLTNHLGVGHSEANATQISQSPPSQNSEPFSTTVRNDRSSPESDVAKSHSKKRKRSDGAEDGKFMTLASNSAETQPACDTQDTPKRTRPKRKTPLRTHLDHEIRWMNGSVLMIDELIEMTDTSIDAIRKKRTRLRREIEVEMELAKRAKDKLTEQKDYLLAWGAEDEKVTNELSPSK